MTESELVGLVGRVVTRIRGADGPGEVRVPIRGTRETFVAYAKAPIERRSAVLVVASRGARAVEVVPWEPPPGESGQRSGADGTAGDVEGWS